MLDVADILSHIKHELGGGDLSTELDKVSVVNQAGHFLYSMHPWRWAMGRAALLDLRGLVSGSTATWTASTSTLTQASAFTNYSFLAGDQIQVTGGTGATTGVYLVASRTSANAIVLDGSLSGSDLTTGDIVWRIDPQTIILPTDLRDIVAIATTSFSNVGGLALVSHGEIIQKRATSASITASTGLYYGAVVFTGSPPRPILEIWPTPSANTPGAMRIFYRSRWAQISEDTETVDVPEWIEDLLLFIARSYAAGYERGNVQSVHQRLAEIRTSPIFEAAVRSDGMTQPYNGLLKNGGPTIWRRGQNYMPQIARQVQSPVI